MNSLSKNKWNESLGALFVIGIGCSKAFEVFSLLGKRRSQQTTTRAQR
jgi:hypothetical protein